MVTPDKPEPQNIIALAMDFDLTLVSKYCEVPVFEAYGIPEAQFWNEKVELEAQLAGMLKHEEQFPEQLRVSPELQNAGIREETLYLNMMFQEGRFPGLSRRKLRELGAQLNDLFFPGVPEFVKELKGMVRSNREWQKQDIKLEFYIISTGIADLIRGSSITPYCDGIIACEVYPDFSQAKGNHADAEIKFVATPVTHTEKTRYIHQIRKGWDIDVNKFVPSEQRRVSGHNIIYVGDGPSDVPAMSALQSIGGKTVAVYAEVDPDNKRFNNAYNLREDGRAFSFGPADYRRGSQTRRTLDRMITDMANGIVKARQVTLDRLMSRGNQQY